MRLPRFLSPTDAGGRGADARGRVGQWRLVHDLGLILDVITALAYAAVGGLAARRLHLPPIVGYLLAGVAIGPFTPGFVGDAQTLELLAELGVVFLMFGVGLHFSLRDLWQVRDIAIPGALIQMTVATGLGYALARGWGWSPGGALLLGAAISVASTVVLLRGLMDHALLPTPPGRVAVGWRVFEDIATVALLVLLPLLAGERVQDGHGSPWTAAGKALRSSHPAIRRTRPPRPNWRPCSPTGPERSGPSTSSRPGAPTA